MVSQIGFPRHLQGMQVGREVSRLITKSKHVAIGVHVLSRVNRVANLTLFAINNAF